METFFSFHSVQTVDQSSVLFSFLSAWLFPYFLLLFHFCRDAIYASFMISFTCSLPYSMTYICCTCSRFLENPYAALILIRMLLGLIVNAVYFQLYPQPDSESHNHSLSTSLSFSAFSLEHLCLI